MPKFCFAAILILMISPAFAIDCNRAKSDVEHAICGDAQAVTADRELGAAYDRLRSSLSDDERAGLRSSQLEWLGEREGTCKAKHADTSLSKCLAEQSEMRQRFLEGKPETGDAEDIRYRPNFIFRPSTKKAARLTVETLTFVGSGAWQAKANAAVEKMVKDAIDEANLDDDQRTTSSENYYVELKISLPFATSRFVSVHAQYSNYLGQAHELRWTTNINIETSAARKLTFDRSVDPGKAEALFKYCRSQILKEKSEGADVHGQSDGQANDVDLSEVMESTKDISSWEFRQSEIVIDYGDYAFGGYGACMCNCVLPYSNIGPAMRQDLRLP
jgi:uncharacterized protein YecT (DUF1311 family)